MRPGSLDQSGIQLQNLNPLGPPLAGIVLFSRNANFQACSQAFNRTFVPVADGDVLTKYDVRMRDLNPPQQTIAPLHVNPAMPNRLANRRIDHPALESSVNGPDGSTQEKEQEQEAGDPTPHLLIHDKYDAQFPCRVVKKRTSIVVFKSQVCDHLFTAEVPQRVLQLHRLNEEIVFGI